MHWMLETSNSESTYWVCAPVAVMHQAKNQIITSVHELNFNLSTHFFVNALNSKLHVDIIQQLENMPNKHGCDLKIIVWGLTAGFEFRNSVEM